MEERKIARTNKDWKSSDELRKQIVALGYDVKDTAENTEIIKV